MPRGHHTQSVKGALAALVLAALAGCETAVVATAPIAPRPVARTVAPQPPSAASETTRVYFATVQADLLSQGLLRTDGGGRDTPYTDRMLADNFIRVALFDEYQRGANGFAQRETESRLRRWQAPVRVGLNFGASVPPDRQATDRARIASYLARLSQITGHPIGLSDSAPNFFLHIVNEDERRALGPVISAALRGLSPSEVAGITGMPRSTYCLVYAVSDSSSSYTRAFACPACTKNWRRGLVWPTTARVPARRSSMMTKNSPC